MMVVILQYFSVRVAFHLKPYFFFSFSLATLLNTFNVEVLV